MPDDERATRQADEEKQTLERIEAQILADYLEKDDVDAFDEAYAARDCVAGD